MVSEPDETRAFGKEPFAVVVVVVAVGQSGAAAWVVVRTQAFLLFRLRRDDGKRKAKAARSEPKEAVAEFLSSPQFSPSPCHHGYDAAVKGVRAFPQYPPTYGSSLISFEKRKAVT
jgi:hypothetical protein